MIELDTRRVWRRDSKVPHESEPDKDSCKWCGLTGLAILQERLGCIAALHPKKPQPPKPKRRNWRFKK